MSQLTKAAHEGVASQQPDQFEQIAQVDADTEAVAETGGQNQPRSEGSTSVSAYDIFADPSESEESEDDGWLTDVSTESSDRDGDYLRSFYDGTEEELEPLVSQMPEGEYKHPPMLISDAEVQPTPYPPGGWVAYTFEEQEYDSNVAQGHQHAQYATQHAAQNALQNAPQPVWGFPYVYPVHFLGPVVPPFMPLNPFSSMPLLPAAVTIAPAQYAPFQSAPYQSPSYQAAPHQPAPELTADQIHNLTYTPPRRRSSNQQENTQDDSDAWCYVA